MKYEQSPLAGALPRPRAGACNKPSPTVSAAIDAFMAAYSGRDHARGQRLSSWKARLGDRPLLELTDDDIFDHLQQIAAEPARIYLGLDADGKPIHRAKGRRAPGTVNRYRDALSAVFAWVIKQRIAPKGWENPARKVEKQPENQGVIRFLDDDERGGLLAACRASWWPRLYCLVLMALTTGARRGELARLRWQDIDLQRCEARVRTTKNGQSNVLPLTKTVATELLRFRQHDAQRFRIALQHQLVFHSDEKPDVAFNFEGPWRAALRASGVTEFRFHDLRHTCASYLAQEGASLLEIANVLNHKQLAMVKRYAHLTVKSKAVLVNRVLGDIA